MSHTFEISGNIVDVISGRIFRGRIWIRNGFIHAISETDVASSQYILPGLIDAHVHIESSMLLPSEFARLAVVHGTVGTVSDPHEIANVLGLDGVEFMIQNASGTPFYFSFGAPSCVPATPFETSGSALGLEEIERLLARNDVGYLAEMMNFPGVINNDPLVAKKLELARRFGKPVDGHAPGVKGPDAQKYAQAGITTDHECYSLDEALDKIRYGMKILIREGSAAKNFDTLLPLLGLHPGMVMFCSDDKHPDDLVKGHMNLLVKRAIQAGFDPVAAIRACTLNPVKHYHLTTGLLQPGDAADFIVVDNLRDFGIMETFIKGQKVASLGKSLLGKTNENPLNRFLAQPVDVSQLEVPSAGGLMNVIEAFNGELITGWIKVQPRVTGGMVQNDIQNDILKLAVLNRYEASSPVVGFIKGFGLKKGALASTVAHDSHNIICVGTNDHDMAEAMNRLIGSKGGICVTDGDTLTMLPLPVAGLMSLEDGYEVAGLYEEINRRAKLLGGELDTPFMTLSFMALLVIPSLKLGDKGLFDGERFSFTGLFD